MMAGGRCCAAREPAITQEPEKYFAVLDGLEHS